MNCSFLILFSSLSGTGGSPAPIIMGETSSWQCGVTLGNSRSGVEGRVTVKLCRLSLSHLRLNAVVTSQQLNGVGRFIR